MSCACAWMQPSAARPPWRMASCRSHPPPPPPEAQSAFSSALAQCVPWLWLVLGAGNTPDPSSLTPPQPLHPLLVKQSITQQPISSTVGVSKGLWDPVSPYVSLFLPQHNAYARLCPALGAGNELFQPCPAPPFSYRRELLVVLWHEAAAWGTVRHLLQDHVP